MKTTTAREILVNSPTFQHLCRVGDGMGVDTSDIDELQGALGLCGFDLVRSVDDGSIQFSDDKSLACFMAMMTIAMDCALSGRLKHGVALLPVN